MVHTIITHHGVAHRDEFLSSCCLLFELFTLHGSHARVERREVTQADLDGSAWVVDTGGVHDPGKRNFDHHQDEANLKNLCAFDLVMLHLVGADTLTVAKNNTLWWQLTSVQDTEGHAAAADMVGVNSSSFAAMTSPIEVGVLSMFAAATSVEPFTPVHTLMLEIGRQIVTSIRGMHASIKAIGKSSITPVEISGVRCLDARKSGIAHNVTTKNLLNRECIRNNCSVLIDNNSNGEVTIYRQNWAKDYIDLSLLAGSPLASTPPHKNGFFIALRGDVTNEQLAELIQQSKIQ